LASGPPSKKPNVISKHWVRNPNYLIPTISPNVRPALRHLKITSETVEKDDFGNLGLFRDSNFLVCYIW
jgi:hypothetical protein